MSQLVTSESVNFHIHPRPSIVCGTLDRGSTPLDAASAAMLKDKCGGPDGIHMSQLTSILSESTASTCNRFQSPG